MCRLGPRYVFISFILVFYLLILPPQRQHQRRRQPPPTSHITPPTSYLHHTQRRPVPTTLSTSTPSFREPKRRVKTRRLGPRYVYFKLFILMFLDQFWLAAGTRRLHLTTDTSPTSPPLCWGPERRIETRRLGPRYVFKNVFFNVFNLFFRPVSTSHLETTPMPHLPHLTHHTPIISRAQTTRLDTSFGP
jgi:hypothetical protein